MDTSEKSEEVKGLLTTGATGKKKKNKKVSWAEDSNLRLFHYFELDETERGKLEFYYLLCNKDSQCPVNQGIVLRCNFVLNFIYHFVSL